MTSTVAAGRSITPTVIVLTCLSVVPDAVASQVATRPSAWSPSAAAQYLDGRLTWWATWPVAARDHETACIACHTGLPYALARPALRVELGEVEPSPSETKLIGDVARRVTSWNDVDPYYPDQTVGLPKTSESRGTEAILNAVILSTRDAGQGRLSSETRRAFANLWKLQFTRGEGAGGWAWLHFDLAPWESDGAAYFGAALAAVAVGIAPGDYAGTSEIRERIELLQAYLLRDWEDRRPFDHVMLLWASSELSGLLTQQEQHSLIADIVRLQRGDGGWGLSSLGEWDGREGYTPPQGSDGYATGLIAFVLQKAGVSPDREELSDALSWLRRNQDATTGRWPASSLNRARDPASDRGLLMSDAATAFAVLALTQAGGS